MTEQSSYDAILEKAQGRYGYDKDWVYLWFAPVFIVILSSDAHRHPLKWIFLIFPLAFGVYYYLHSRFESITVDGTGVTHVAWYGRERLKFDLAEIYPKSFYNDSRLGEVPRYHLETKKGPLWWSARLSRSDQLVALIGEYAKQLDNPNQGAV